MMLEQRMICLIPIRSGYEFSLADDRSRRRLSAVISILRSRLLRRMNYGRWEGTQPKNHIIFHAITLIHNISPLAEYSPMPDVISCYYRNPYICLSLLSLLLLSHNHEDIPPFFFILFSKISPT